VQLYRLKKERHLKLDFNYKIAKYLQNAEKLFSRHTRNSSCNFPCHEYLNKKNIFPTYA